MIRLAAPDDAERVRELLREYVTELGVDLSFQDFETEVSDPLAFYDVVLLAPHGCVAVRRIDDSTCEMKRLYVQDAARRGGLGGALAETAIAHARARGYDRMRLDTLPTMQAARALYERLGFRDIAPYRENPIDGTAYLELEL